MSNLRSTPGFACLLRALPIGFLAMACANGPTEPEPEPFRSETVTFSSDVPLQGTLYLPDAADPVAGVVIVPGSGPVDRDGIFLPDPGLLPPVLPAVGPADRRGGHCRPALR